MSDTITPEVSHPTSACPHPEQWSCYDSEGTEIEVLDLLQSLVVAMKPKMLIETGCYRGYGTEQIARGVQRNGFGTFWSTDIGHDMVQITRDRLVDRQLNHLVTVHHEMDLQLIAHVPQPIDFAFLDSGADDMRCLELRAVLPRLAPSGLVVIHDCAIQHGLRSHFFPTVRELKLEFLTLDTPRGLAMVRKPWGDL